MSFIVASKGRCRCPLSSEAEPNWEKLRVSRLHPQLTRCDQTDKIEQFSMALLLFTNVDNIALLLMTRHGKCETSGRKQHLYTSVFDNHGPNLTIVVLCCAWAWMSGKAS